MNPQPAHFKIPITLHFLKLAEFPQPNKHIAAEQPSKFRPPRSRQRKNRFTEGKPFGKATHTHTPPLHKRKQPPGSDLKVTFPHRLLRTSGPTSLFPDARHSRTRSDAGFEHFEPLLTGKFCDFRTRQLQFDGQPKKTSV